MDVFREIVNIKSTKVHLRPLQVAHNTYGTTCDELLSMNSDVSVHQWHIRFLATEAFKSNFCVVLFQDGKNPYDLRKENTLHLPPIHSTRHGINSLLFRASRLWNNLPREIKESLSTKEFQKILKKHEGLPCSCVVCRRDIFS